MNKEEATLMLRRGHIKAFNHYRENHPDWVPDLSGIKLDDIGLVEYLEGKIVAADLHDSILCGTNLPHTWNAYTILNPFDTNDRVSVNFKGALIDANTTYGGFDLIGAGAIVVSNSEAQKLIIHLPQVFISYAWVNEGVVLAIDRWLRLKRLTTKIDKRDFFAGARIRDEITRVMKECDVILIFYSESSRDKPWTEFERDLASDLEIEAKRDGKKAPRIIYIVIDDSPLPTISEKNRIAIMAKGKRFELVCEEIYHNILELPRNTKDVDLSRWQDFVF